MISLSAKKAIFGRLIFAYLQCWEALPFCRFQRQRCIKVLYPKDPDFYTPLALKMAKGQRLPALEVYKNQSPNIGYKTDPVTTEILCASRGSPPNSWGNEWSLIGSLEVLLPLVLM